MTIDELSPIAQRAQAPAQLPPLPSDVGLTWRPLTPADVPEWLALMTTVEEHDDAIERTSENELADSFKGNWRNAATDTVGGFDPDGRLRAFARTEFRPATEGTLAPVLLGAVHPEYRRRGVGRALLAWAESRARQQLADTDSRLPARLRLFIDDILNDIKSMAGQAGFAPIRWYRDMLRDLSEPLPEPRSVDGVTIQRYTPDMSEQVRITHNEAFVPDHWGSNPMDREPWDIDFVGSDHFRPGWSFVAVDDSTGQIAGYAMSAAYEEEWAAHGFSQGWTETIAVRREYRGRGVAQGLLAASMSTFKEAGMQYAALGVDSDNPTGAVGLYTKLGYRPGRTFVLYTKELNEL